MKLKITNIDWDTDGEEVDLPTEVILDIDSDDVVEIDDDFIGDLLSERYGWCHKGFAIEDCDKLKKWE